MATSQIADERNGKELPRTGCWAWEAKVGNVAKEVCYETKRVCLPSGKWVSFEDLDRMVEWDLAEYGYSLSFDGSKYVEIHVELAGGTHRALEPLDEDEEVLEEVEIEGLAEFPSTPSSTSRMQHPNTVTFPRSTEEIASDGCLDHRSGVVSSTEAQKRRRSMESGGQSRSGVTSWSEGTVALYSDKEVVGGRFVTVLVVAEEAARKTSSGPDLEGLTRVTDGVSTFSVAPKDLQQMEVSRDLLSRLQSSNGASTPSTPVSPHVEKPRSQWAWLSPVGLGEAEVREVAVPKRAVPHLVGKGGSMIRSLEDHLGIIVGVADGVDEGAIVTLFGPAPRIEAARPILEGVGKGAWSRVSRIRHRWHSFV